MSRIVIDKNGKISSIYQDGLPILNIGDTEIKRVSYVEPVGNARWEIQYCYREHGTVGPFNSRKEALEEEYNYIQQLLEGSG